MMVRLCSSLVVLHASTLQRHTRTGEGVVCTKIHKCVRVCVYVLVSVGSMKMISRKSVSRESRSSACVCVYISVKKNLLPMYFDFLSYSFKKKIFLRNWNS